MKLTLFKIGATALALAITWGQGNASDLNTQGSKAETSSLAEREADLRRIETNRIDAMMNKDVDVLRSVMHPNFVHITTSGSRTTAISDWNPAIEFAFFELNDDSCIRFFGDVAIVDGTYSNAIKDENGKPRPTKHARYARVYLYSSQLKTWQLISHQATRLSKPLELSTAPSSPHCH